MDAPTGTTLVAMATTWRFSSTYTPSWWSRWASYNNSYLGWWMAQTYKTASSTNYGKTYDYHHIRTTADPIVL